VVRIIRMVRVFRIFKMAKFSAGVSLIGETLLRSAPALSVLLITIGILVSLSRDARIDPLLPYRSIVVA
jgi:hypothetical protein